MVVELDADSALTFLNGVTERGMETPAGLLWVAAAAVLGLAVLVGTVVWWLLDYRHERRRGCQHIWGGSPMRCVRCRRYLLPRRKRWGLAVWLWWHL